MNISRQDAKSPLAWLGRYVRPKNFLDPGTLAILIVAGLTPVVMVLARLLALPGAGHFGFPGFDLLHALGSNLNQSLTLQWVPPDDRPHILYLLLLPTGALLLVLARLTFGLRILGFRAILLAIGFQSAGFLPSLILIAVVIGTIGMIRPSMKRVKLPLFARISVILCCAAMIMVGALLLAPLLRSEVVWNVAFFPVIILAMMAEGLAKSLANDSLLLAVWRAFWTIAVALIFVGVSTIPAVRYCALNFPELMLTQLVLIVLIAEFLDLRLLERWPARLAQLVERQRDWRVEKPVIALIRNRWSRGIIGRLGRAPAPKYRRRTLQHIVDALRHEGFRVKVVEGDTTLLPELAEILAPNPVTGAPSGLALNLATGVQGNARFGQVPAMLELAGIPYSGPDALAHANLLDRYVLLMILRDAGLPVSRFVLAPNDPVAVDALRFPVLVKARAEPDERYIQAENYSELEAAITAIQRATGRTALIEEHIAGREISVGILGNTLLECLPLLERGKAGKGEKLCPAPIDGPLAEELRNYARCAFTAAGCRDYARIDFLLPTDGSEPLVTEVRWDGILSRTGSFAMAAEAAGYSFAQLMHRIVDTAAQRYGPLPRATSHGDWALGSSLKWLPDTRASAP